MPPKPSQLVPVSFDPLTKQHTFVPQYFKGRPARFISWLKGTTEGATVVAGARLGIIEWDDGTSDDILAAVGGVISVVNHNISDGTLQDTPAQLAIVFA